jgi:hypothetical protein
MRELDKRTRVSRRVFLRHSATAVPAAAAIATGMTITPDAAWADTATTLKPRTLVTLARLARDIYPHDRLADAYYIKAVAGYDGLAAKDPKLARMIEDGVATLDAAAQKKFGADYVAVAWERDRVALLTPIADAPLAKKLRGDMMLTLYNNPEVWPKFGYEGSSADKGGYINRGFSDIDWLPTA